MLPWIFSSISKVSRHKVERRLVWLGLFNCIANDWLTAWCLLWFSVASWHRSLLINVMTCIFSSSFCKAAPCNCSSKKKTSANQVVTHNQFLNALSSGGKLLSWLPQMKVGHPYKEYLKASKGNGSGSLFIDSTLLWLFPHACWLSANFFCYARATRIISDFVLFQQRFSCYITVF